MERFAKIVSSYSYFSNISFSRSLLYDKKNNFFNTSLIFTPEVFIQSKNVWDPRGPGAKGREFFVYLFVYRENQHDFRRSKTAPGENSYSEVVKDHKGMRTKL